MIAKVEPTIEEYERKLSTIQRTILNRLETRKEYSKEKIRLIGDHSIESAQNQKLIEEKIKETKERISNYEKSKFFFFRKTSLIENKYTCDLR